MTDETERLQLQMRSRLDGADMVFSLYGGLVQGDPLEICRLPAGFVYASGMRRELTDLLGRMALEGVSDMLRSAGAEVTFKKLVDEPEGTQH